LFAGLNLIESVFELLSKQHPIGQIGKRVVMRQMGDLLFRALRSVTSSIVATQPPDSSGWLMIWIALPSGASVT